MNIFLLCAIAMIVKKLFYLFVNFSLVTYAHDTNDKVPIFTLNKEPLKQIFHTLKAKDSTTNNENFTREYHLLPDSVNNIPFLVTYYNQYKITQSKIFLFELI